MPIFASDTDHVHRLLIDGVEFYRTNIKSDLKFAKIPIKVFRAADTVAAFQHCLDPSQMGEAVIRFREHDIVKVCNRGKEP